MGNVENKEIITSNFPVEDILYKFYSQKTALCVLDNLEFKFSHYSTYNDPFESWVLYVSPLLKSIRDLELNDSILTEKEELEARKFGFYYNSSTSSYEENCYFEIRRKIEKKYRLHRILCLSSTCENPLLWGHYTENSTGLAIGLDFDKLKDKFKKRLKPMRYSRFPIEGDENNALFTKYIDWSYENEWRILIKHKYIRFLKLHVNDVTLNDLYIRFPEEYIKRIVFAPKADADFMNKILRLIESKRTNKFNPEIFCSYLSKNEYKVYPLYYDIRNEKDIEHFRIYKEFNLYTNEYALDRYSKWKHEKDGIS